MLRKKYASLPTSLQLGMAVGPNSDQQIVSGNLPAATSGKAMLPLFFWVS